MNHNKKSNEDTSYPLGRGASLSQKVIGNRGGRIEPRAIKRRHNDFPLLMKPRSIAKEEVRKNGHPKKLK